MKEIEVILVDEHDNPIGLMPKMEAHQKGVLHRALSVFLFDLNGNWMLQNTRCLMKSFTECLNFI